MNTVLHSLGCKNLGRAFVALLVTGIVLTHPASAEAAEATVPISFIVGNLWLLVAAALVFIMHLGFATLEAGLTQHKNTVNILFKNVCIVSVGLLTYAVIGFNLMYPGEEYAGSFFGFSALTCSKTKSTRSGFSEKLKQQPRSITPIFAPCTKSMRSKVRPSSRWPFLKAKRSRRRSKNVR